MYHAFQFQSPMVPFRRHVLLKVHWETQVMDHTDIVHSKDKFVSDDNVALLVPILLSRDSRDYAA